MGLPALHLPPGPVRVWLPLVHQPTLMAEPAPDMALTAWTGHPERPFSLAASIWPMEMSWRSAWAARAWARPLKVLAPSRGCNLVCPHPRVLLSWEEGRGLLLWIEKSPSRKIATSRGRGPSLDASCSCLGRGDTRGRFFFFPSMYLGNRNHPSIPGINIRPQLLHPVWVALAVVTSRPHFTGASSVELEF